MWALMSMLCHGGMISHTTEASMDHCCAAVSATNYCMQPTTAQHLNDTPDDTQAGLMLHGRACCRPLLYSLARSKPAAAGAPSGSTQPAAVPYGAEGEEA